MALITRRRFIKGSLITGTALTAYPFLFIPKARASWARKTSVHPNVNPLRVVGITDPKMTRAKELVTSWSRQEKLVIPEAVFENMDKLVCRLVDTRNPEEAWRAIFLKPSRKSWSETVVAIKTNHISQQHTRSAVVAKVCTTLVHLLGVTPTNIHIYDATHGKGMSQDTPFSGLPAGVRIEDRWGGVTTLTDVSAPWQKGDNKARCLKHLVDGTVDILVNIALCKGHSDKFGGFTMTMKNHLGTFDPSYAHRSGATDYLMAINQTPEILGSMDKKGGHVLFPRQQLCIVDALWASEGGPSGYPRHQPNFLAMGVFSPVLDYILATQFRAQKMGWDIDREITRRLLTDFGYAESDLPDGGKILEVA
jgi:hypothetical protein